MPLGVTVQFTVVVVVAEQSPVPEIWNSRSVVGAAAVKVTPETIGCKSVAVQTLAAFSVVQPVPVNPLALQVAILIADPEAIEPATP